MRELPDACDYWQDLKPLVRFFILMKHLFVSRHGKDDEMLNLTPEGYQQYDRIGQAIKGIIGIDQLLMLSSAAPRALRSAQQAQTHLPSALLEEHLYLWDAGDGPEGSYNKDTASHDEKLGKVLALVQQTNVPAVHLTVHADLAEDFPKYYARKELNTHIYGSPLRQGDLCHLDLEKGTYNLFIQPDRWVLDLT